MYNTIYIVIYCFIHITPVSTGYYSNTQYKIGFGITIQKTWFLLDTFLTFFLSAVMSKIYPSNNHSLSLHVSKMYL